MINSQRVTFDQALKDIRNRTLNPEDRSVRTTERGKAFEKLMIHYFKHDSLFRDEFVEVKSWDEWYDEPDTGIDIVARDRRGELVGIQCKCNADDDRLDLKDFSTMFTIQDRGKVNRLMLVFTGEGLTPHAQKYCDEAHVYLLTQSDLRTCSIDWSTSYTPEPKQLRPHQVEAVEKTVQGLKGVDRGKLIMACGTGKTLTALHIAERIGGLVLYLVPSLSLIPQTMREWADNRHMQHQYVAVCSDKSAAKDEQGSITEIPIKPSTNVGDIVAELNRAKKPGTMRVVFSTYNSVTRVGEAIRQTGDVFDLILFDEAHRTTGAEGIKESYYLAAHSDESVPARKRLYMTATPRVYAWKGKVAAQEKGLNVYSMDDVTKYGDTLYSLQFSEAVEKKLLTPFQVVMREVDQGDTYGEIIQAAREQGEDIADYGDVDLGYLTKIGGILKAITYPDGGEEPPRPLQRVMVFHNTIKKSRLFAGDGFGDKAKKPLKLDKATQQFHHFDKIAEHLLNNAGLKYRTETKHVDGATSSRSRGIRIDWLRASDQTPDEIRLLSNARCLQEGVDVPALDAVVFMEPKKSPIDIIQSIGRVMRTTEGKELGYVIIPIPVLKGDDPNYALHKNRRYEQISQILRAILAHDDKLRRLLNEYALRQSKTGRHTETQDPQEIPPALADWLAKNLGSGVSKELLSEIQTVMLSLGDSSYHANIGERLGEQAVVIQNILEHQIEVDSSISDIVNEVHGELQNVVGSTLTVQQTVKALAQHAVMTRVFKTLFPGNHNPVATAFDKVLDRLNIQGQMKEFETFYLGLEADFEHFKEPGSKQDFVRAIYDAFFRGADKKAATKHGIVHTPVEIVDFILDSVQYALQSEFGKSLDDRRVKVLDPFTGTGIFLAQLLERGMISFDVIREKYLHDVYANEIMLPAFYVAAANIETAYQKVAGEYLPFEGISYMDTFGQHPSYRLESRYREKQASLVDSDLREASERVKQQGMEDINVIIGNPPYSAGQKSANDDNKNVSHPELAGLIKNTYIKYAPKGNKMQLYNSYLKALRWASDRIGESGVIGFIIPSAWITGNAEAGVRACIHEEFTDVYCFDLLGQKGIPGHGRNIFEYHGTSEGGTTVSTSIVILVKNPSKTGCSIRYASLSKTEYEGEQKRSKVKELKDISHVSWDIISPDKYHDWLNQRGELADEWDNLTPIGSKEGKRGKTDKVLFRQYSVGLVTARDAWIYNSSKNELSNNMKRHISYCNSQNLDNPTMNPRHAKWSPELSSSLSRLPKKPSFEMDLIRTALFRPFFKQFVYFEKKAFIHRPGLIPSFYPTGEVENLSILVPDKIKGEFSTMITDTTPDLHVHEANQAFPIKTKKQNCENVSQVAPPTSNLQPPTSNLQPPENLAIIVPDKIKGEFSVFITNMTPDLEVVHHGQVFPMKVMMK